MPIMNITQWPNLVYVSVYMRELIFRTSTIKLSIIYMLLKSAGLLLHTYCCTVAHVFSCKHLQNQLIHSPLPILLLHRTLMLKKKPRILYTEVIFFFTVSDPLLLVLYVSRFFFFLTWPEIMKESKQAIDGSDGAV